MIPKKIFNRKSKTHLVAALVSALGAVMTFLPTVAQHIPQEWYGPAIVIIGVVFHVLRNVTRTDIEAK